MKHDSTTTKFAIIPEWVLYHDGLSFAARAVYGALAAHADRDSGQCWPSQAPLAKKLHTSERTVKRAIAELREVGAITVTSRRARGQVKTSNLYQLHKDGPHVPSLPSKGAEVPKGADSPVLDAADATPHQGPHMARGQGPHMAPKPDPVEPDPSSVTPNGTFHAQTSLSRESSPSPTSDLDDAARRRLRSALMAVGDALDEGHDFHDAAVGELWGDFLDALEYESRRLDYADTLIDLAESKWTVTAAVQAPYAAGVELTKMLNTARRRDQLRIA